jgi:hypothetical protein
MMIAILSTCATILAWCCGRAVYRQLKPWPTGSGPTHYGSIKPR